MNKQTESVKLSFNGPYANRESGMEQARRIPRPFTNRSPTKWVRFVDEDWGARIWSFNGSYANRESGMEQAQRIPRPLTN